MIVLFDIKGIVHVDWEPEQQSKSAARPLSKNLFGNGFEDRGLRRGVGATLKNNSSRQHAITQRLLSQLVPGSAQHHRAGASALSPLTSPRVTSFCCPKLSLGWKGRGLSVGMLWREKRRSSREAYHLMTCCTASDNGRLTERCRNSGGEYIEGDNIATA